MLRVGFSGSRTNYSNNNQGAAFGASKYIVQELIENAIKTNTAGANNTHKHITTDVYKLARKEMFSGNFIAANTTAFHLNKIGEEMQKKGFIKLGNKFIYDAGRIKGHLENFIGMIRSAMEFGEELPLSIINNLKKFDKAQKRLHQSGVIGEKL